MRFLLIDSADDCRVAIDSLLDSDIAIFDLMRESPDGQIERVGIELYRHAIGRGVPENRVFVLTGFPHLLEKEINVPKEQKLLKPISPTEVAERIVMLFPDLYRPRRN